MTGLVERVAGVEQIPDELPHQGDHVGGDDLGEEPVELGAGRVRVPVDVELHGGQHLGGVFLQEVGLPLVEAVAEVDDLGDGSAGDAWCDGADDVFGVGAVASAVAAGEQSGGAVAYGVLVRGPDASGV
jgi:hypothetical protein